MSQINKYTPVPLYYQLAEVIKDSLRQKKLKPGERIPSEDELCELHAVSRTTVRSAIQLLVDQGYLFKARGIATLVARQHLRREGSDLTGFSEDVKRMGRQPGSKVVALVYEAPPTWVQDALSLSPRDKTPVLTRIRLIDGEEVAVHICYLSPRLAIALDELRGVSSLYAFLESKKATVIAQAEETLEARAAPPRIASWLDIKKNAPILYVRRTSFDEKGLLVECVEGFYRSDRYQHYMLLQRH